jgi:hypothetical protein
VSEALAERYVRLALRVDRHVDGMVDAYFGPAELAEAVRDEPLVEPRQLVADADGLLDELEDGWLRDQAAALRTFAGVLAGESRSYPDEVEECYGVRPTYTDEAVFEAAHDRLDELLPGGGSLLERYDRWRGASLVPPDRVEAMVSAVVEEARTLTRDLVELPDGEGVGLESVRDVPWLAYNHYLGDLRSTVSINLDLPQAAHELLHLAIHETYAGHHAERCCKEHALVRGRGLLEETVVLIAAPQSLVSEGIAEVAPLLLLEGEGGSALASALHDGGVEFDLEEALAVERAREPFRWAQVNAVLMLYDGEASEEETQAYLERWEVIDAQLAAHMIRFFTEPTSRSYVVTYPAGRELCRTFVERHADGFRRLLTEQVRVGDLLAARDGGSP